MRKLSFLLPLLILFFSCSSTGKKSGESGSRGFLSNSSGDDLFFADDIDKNNSTEKEKENKNPVTSSKNREVEEGYAAWYGKEMQGKATASGEIFNMNDYTASHRTFPIGSNILITNLENNKKRMVRINDRGPYVEGRVSDVSYATALELGFVEKGVAHVQLELIEKGKFSFLSKLDTPMDRASEPRTEEPLTASDGEEDFFFTDGRRPEGYTIQVGAFKRRVNAENHRDQMEERFNHRTFIATKGKWHFVWLGDVSSSEKAKSLMQKLQVEGVEVMYRGKVY